MSGHVETPPAFVYGARLVVLHEGDAAEGVVLRLPGKKIHSGNRIFLLADGSEVICLPATARAGWAVLESELTKKDIAVGDRIAVRFSEWRVTKDRERRYRDVELTIIGRAGERAA